MAGKWNAPPVERIAMIKNICHVSTRLLQNRYARNNVELIIEAPDQDNTLADALEKRAAEVLGAIR